MCNFSSDGDESDVEDYSSQSGRAECDSLSPPREGFDSCDDWEDPYMVKALKHDLDQRYKRIKTVKRERKPMRDYLKEIECNLKRGIQENEVNDLLWNSLAGDCSHRSRSPWDSDGGWKGAWTSELIEEKSPAEVFLPPRPPSPLSTKSLYLAPDIFLKLAESFEEQMGRHGLHSWLWGDFLRPEPPCLCEPFILSPTKMKQSAIFWTSPYKNFYKSSVANEEPDTKEAVYETGDDNEINFTHPKDSKEYSSTPESIDQKVFDDPPKEVANSIQEETTASVDNEHIDTNESSSITSTEVNSEEPVKEHELGIDMESSKWQLQNNSNRKNERSKEVPIFVGIESPIDIQKDLLSEPNTQLKLNSQFLPASHTVSQSDITKRRVKPIPAKEVQIQGLHVPRASMLRALERAKMKEKREASRQDETESNIFRHAHKRMTFVKNPIPMNSQLRAESRAQCGLDKVVKQQPENDTTHSPKTRSNINRNPIPMNSLLRAQARSRMIEKKVSQRSFITQTSERNRISAREHLAAGNSIAGTILRVDERSAANHEKDCIANVINRKKGVKLPPIEPEVKNKQYASNYLERTNRCTSSHAGKLQKDTFRQEVSEVSTAAVCSGSKACYMPCKPRHRERIKRAQDVTLSEARMSSKHSAMDFAAKAAPIMTVGNRLPPIKGVRLPQEITGISKSIVRNSKKPLPPVVPKSDKLSPLQ